MNFTSFGGVLPGGGSGLSAGAGAGAGGAGVVPSIHQFAAKFGYEGANTALHSQDTRTYQSGVQLTGQGATLVEMNVGKFRAASDGAGAGVVVSIGNAPAAHHSVGGTGTIPLAPLNTVTVNTGVKYQTMTASATVGTVGALGAVGTLGAVGVESVGYCGQLGYVPELQPLRDSHAKRDYREDHIMGTIHHIQQHHVGSMQGLQQQPQQLVVVLTDPKDVCKVKQERDRFHLEDALATTAEFISVDAVPVSTWQQLGGVGAGVADYLSALPLQLHHLLKYSESTTGAGSGGKRDQPTILATLPVSLHQQHPTATIQANTLSGVVVQTATIINEPIAESPPPITLTAATNTTPVTTSKKKKKKKNQKEKKPRPKPGEIRLTTALDGSTLYCCPECHMAYPERGLLEQHLLGHTMERKFICEICNAALKRKDHLTRHKQSHNPERPYVCSVCLKAFKRKEQLTLHFVIHSGEKRHVCQECGKGFYRKDHLRKHTRSHIARRVKAELASGGASGTLPRAVPAPQLPAPLHRV